MYFVSKSIGRFTCVNFGEFPPKYPHPEQEVPGRAQHAPEGVGVGYSVAVGTTRQHGFCPVHPSCNSVQNFPWDLNKTTTKSKCLFFLNPQWNHWNCLALCFQIFFLSPRNQRLEILLWFKGYNWYFYFPLTWAANKCAKEGITAGRFVSVWRHKFVRLLPRTSLSAYNALQVTRTLWGNQIVWKNGWNIRLSNYTLSTRKGKCIISEKKNW